MLKKKLRSMAIITAICLSSIRTTALATETDHSVTNCEATLQACDRYVGALEAETKIMKQALNEQQRAIRQLENEQAALPWYAYVLLGAAAGVLAMEVAR